MPCRPRRSVPFANRSFFVSDSIPPLPSVVLSAGDEDGTVRVWNTEAGTGVYTFRHVHGSQKMTSMCFDTELRRLITRSVQPSRIDSPIRILWKYHTCLASDRLCAQPHAAICRFGMLSCACSIV